MKNREHSRMKGCFDSICVDIIKQQFGKGKPTRVKNIPTNDNREHKYKKNIPIELRTYTPKKE
jgi:hypothetical protein